MIVGVDYTAAAWQGAGIGRYTRELIRFAVARSSDIQFVLFFAAGNLDPSSPYVHAMHALRGAFPTRVRLVPIPLSPRLLTIFWQRARVPFPAERFTGTLDIVHAPDFVLPPTRARTILTIHDLTFMVRPECSPPRLQRYLTRVVPRSVRRADHILVDSDASARDVTRLLRVSPRRMTTIYPGVNQRYRPLTAASTAPVRARLDLPARFLLFVGTLEPRKNLVLLLEALATMPDVPPLVIAGKRGWLYQPIFDTLDRLALHNRVLFLDFVAEDDLPALYNLADVFVYPSLYEGFGLPVLEALACGTPTVTSAVASLPEVANNAALLVDPTRPAAIAAGIRQALAHPAPLRAAGPVQAARFQWQHAADQLVHCYHAVCPTTRKA